MQSYTSRHSIRSQEEILRSNTTGPVLRSTGLLGIAHTYCRGLLFISILSCALRS